MSVNLLMQALSDEIVKRVANISGQNVYQCMQCGTCSGVCPMSDEMELTPRQAMLLLQHGMGEPVVDSRTPWLCASCHTCQVRCPRGIEIPRVMEAVRQVTLRQNKDKVNPRALTKDAVRELPQIAMVAGFRKLTA